MSKLGRLEQKCALSSVGTVGHPNIWSAFRHKVIPMSVTGKTPLNTH